MKNVVIEIAPAPSLDSNTGQTSYQVIADQMEALALELRVISDSSDLTP